MTILKNNTKGAKKETEEYEGGQGREEDGSGTNIVRKKQFGNFNKISECLMLNILTIKFHNKLFFQ